jgi:putative hydrolase of the HAD superfamily
VARDFGIKTQVKFPQRIDHDKGGPVKAFRAIAFDLDDTLLDTTNLIVPHSVQESYRILIAGGIEINAAEMEKIREEKIKSTSHREIFKALAEQYHLKNPAALDRAIEAFYTPQVPPSLPLLPDAVENLAYLKDHYSLYLVTSGQFQTQSNKIRSMGIKSYFRDIYIIDGMRFKKKREAFLDIIEREKISPQQLLSVGNRLASEIRDGKIVGAQTCYFCYGEHVGEKPEQAEDHPDYTVFRHSEIIRTCNL